MLDAREIKSADEIALLTHGAAMVDGTYQAIVEALKPGLRENELVALANKRLYEMDSADVEASTACRESGVTSIPPTSPIDLFALATRFTSTLSSPTTDTERATTAPST
jgi:hypothetical protein